jgi:hypothetical protein
MPTSRSRSAASPAKPLRPAISTMLLLEISSIRKRTRTRMKPEREV